MGGRSGGSGFSTGTLSTEFGDVDLTNIRLKYGKDDSKVDKVIRDKLEIFEDGYINDKKEFSVTYREDGSQVGKIVTGTEHNVTPIINNDRNLTISHIHPRSGVPNELGGTFSVADIGVYADYSNIKTMRAAAKEGIYSITKGAHFDKQGFVDYFKKEQDKNRLQYRKEIAKIRMQVGSGNISAVEALRLNSRAFNKYLVANHESLLRGRNKYGYDYTLERWKY